MILNDKRAIWMLVAIIAAITCGCNDASPSTTSEYQFRGFNELIGVPLNKAEQKFAGRYRDLDVDDEGKISSEAIYRKDHTYTYVLRYRDDDEDGNPRGEIVAEVYHGVWAVTGDYLVCLTAYAEDPNIDDEYFDELIPIPYKVDSWEKKGYRITQVEDEYSLQGTAVESFEFEQMQQYNPASAIENAGAVVHQKMREKIPTLLGPKGNTTTNQEFANAVIEGLPATTPEKLVESVLGLLANDEMAKFPYLTIPPVEDILIINWQARPEKLIGESIGSVKRELNESIRGAHSHAESVWKSLHESLDIDWSGVTVDEIKYDISIDDSFGVDMKVADVEVLISAQGEKLPLEFEGCRQVNGRWYVTRGISVQDRASMN